MLHVPALPGSPASAMSFADALSWVCRDADALQLGGVDGMILENFGDTPFFPKRVPAHTVAFMSVLAREVKKQVRLPLGLNVLRNDGIAAVAVAASSGAEFIRVNVYTGARVTDQGVLEGEAHRIQRYRRMLGSDVKIFADVAVKHSAPLGKRALPEEVEEALYRGRADAVIVSGTGTGKPTDVEDVRLAKIAAGDHPVFVGSGVRIDGIATLVTHADGLIVGTSFKQGSAAANPVDAARVQTFMAHVNELR